MSNKPFGQKRVSKNDKLPQIPQNTPSAEPSNPMLAPKARVPKLTHAQRSASFAQGVVPKTVNPDLPTNLFIDDNIKRRLNTVGNYLGLSIKQKFHNIITPEIFAHFNSNMQITDFGEAVACDADLSNRNQQARHMTKFYLLAKVDTKWENDFPICKGQQFILWQVHSKSSFKYIISDFYFLEDPSKLSVKSFSKVEKTSFMQKLGKIIGVEKKPNY